MVILVAAIWAVAIMLPPSGSRSERRAEKELCVALSKQVQQGDASLADYLGTRCAAKLLAGLNGATENGGQR